MEPMGCLDHGAARGLLQAGDDPSQRGALGGINAGQGFVQQQQTRSVDHGTGKGHAKGLSGRQLIGPMLQPMAHADGLHGREGEIVAIMGIHASESERQLHLADGIQLR